MADTTDKWQRKLDDSIGHAQNVFEHEVERLQKQAEKTDSAEAREIKHVEKQVARDARFAAHHIQYLENVISHEANRVDKAYDRVARRKAKGASDESIHRAAERAVRIEAAADEHIEHVFRSTVKHIERDIKAAAHHVIEGFDDIELDEESLGYKVEIDAKKVSEALEKIEKQANA